jgi:hypothetical protein
MAALVAGLARPLIHGFRAGTSGAPLRLVPMAILLTLIQVGGFLVMEVGERILFTQGHSLNIFGESVVFWGLALQVVTALLATIAVRLLARVGEFVARLRRSAYRSETTPTHWLTTQTHTPTLANATGGRSLRAPPLVR